MTWLLAAGMMAGAFGCGSDDEKPNDTGFSGDRIDGTIYFQAGKRPGDQDLYRARGSLDVTKRLTRGGRVSILSGGGDVLAASNARGSGGDRLEQLDPDSDSPLPGKLLDMYGQSPDISPTGKVLYQVQQYKPDGGDAGATLYVMDRPGAKRRLVYRARPGKSFSGAWGPDERPIVVSDNGEAAIVLGPGGERKLELGINAAYVESNRQGRLWAYDAKNKLAVIEPDGRRRVLSTPWKPLTWSPDGQSILAVRGPRLGLLSQRDGSAREIGQVRGVRVADAVWLRRGR